MTFDIGISLFGSDVGGVQAGGELVEVAKGIFFFLTKPNDGNRMQNNGIQSMQTLKGS